MVGGGRYFSSHPFLPDEIKKLPVCGDWRGLSRERILSLSPDLIIGGRNLEDEREFFKRHGIEVFVFSPESLPELIHLIGELGKILGKERRAETLCSYMEDAIGRVKKMVEGKGRPVVYLAGSDPMRTFGKGSAWGSLIEIAGGKNPAEIFSIPWPKISPEVLLSWNPDCILIVPFASYGPEYFLERREFRVIKAVKEKRIHKLSPYLSWSPSLVLSLFEIANYIHPEVEVNLEKERKELEEITGISY